MKKLACLVLFFIVYSFVAFGQGKKDTTKIKMGKTKIIIIEDEADEESIKKLENGRKDFEAQMRELKMQQDSLKKQMKTLEDQEKKAELQAKIKEKQEKIDAFENGIDNIDKEIAEIEEEMGEKDDELKEAEEEADFDIEFGDEDWSEEWDFGKRIIKRKKKFQGHWAGLDIGLNNFMNEDYTLEMPENGEFMELNTARSWGVSLNFLEYNIPIIKSYVGLVTGMGFEWNHYYFDKKVRLIEDDATGAITGETLDRDFQKNKLNTTYFNIPLILEIQIPASDGHRIHLAGGAVGGVRLGAKTKQTYELDGKKVKDKVKDDYNTSPYRYGLTFRVGYRGLRLFANYSMVPLFEKDKGPELYPFTVGLTIIDF